MLGFLSPGGLRTLKEQSSPPFPCYELPGLVHFELVTGLPFRIPLNGGKWDDLFGCLGFPFLLASIPYEFLSSFCKYHLYAPAGGSGCIW